MEEITVVVMVTRIVPALAALGLLTSAAASTIQVQVLGTTQTRAILAYNAPDTSSCSAVVLDSSNTTVHDTDPTLFAGADSDTRAGNLANGTYRVVIVGKRS